MTATSSLFVILAIATAITALPTTGISRRDPQTILADLQAIDTAVKSMTQTVSSWDGGLLSALSIQSQANDVGDQIDQASQAVSSEPGPASPSDTSTILSFVTDTLTPDVQATMDALVAQKPSFDDDSLSGLVSSTLTDLRGRASLVDGLVALASPEQQAAARAAADGVQGAMDSAIGVFSA